MRPGRTVVLCGFSGAGKSETGRILARRLGWGFVDTDDAVAEKLGMSIPDVFDLRGERRFREAEKEVIRLLPCDASLVVAVGGGAVVDPENLNRLTRRGLLVYLRVTPETARQRLQGSHRRPKLDPPADDRHAPSVDVPAIAALMREREPFYRLADDTVDTEGKTSEEVAMEIEQMVSADEKRVVDNR